MSDQDENVERSSEEEADRFIERSAEEPDFEAHRLQEGTEKERLAERLQDRVSE